MAHKITDEDIQRLQQAYEQNQIKASQPEYEEVEGFDHLEVYMAGGRCRVEYGDRSIEIGNNPVDLAGISELLNSYNEHGDFERAYRQHYKSRNTKARKFKHLIDADEELESDLSKLAEELDPA